VCARRCPTGVIKETAPATQNAAPKKTRPVVPVPSLESLLTIGVFQVVGAVHTLSDVGNMTLDNLIAYVYRQPHCVRIIQEAKKH